MRLTVSFAKRRYEQGFARRCVFCVLSCFIFVAIFTPVLLAEVNRVKAEFRKYERIDTDTILFKSGVGHGITLADGEAVEFVIPEEFRGRLPNYSVIKHRKDRSFIDDPLAYDENSPWISVYYRDSGTGVWHVWQDQFGPEKRAAVAPWFKPKQNTLYNFPEYVGRFSPDRVRVVNRGSGDLSRAVASVNSLEIVYLTAEERCVGANKTLAANALVKNTLTIEYSVSSKNGVELRPGHSIEFVFSAEFSGRNIASVILKHRKDQAFAADPENYEAFDPDAAYILCEARSSIDKNWYRWADRSSFAKFSEVRTPDNPENETLHNGLRTFGRIEPDRFRITNVAKGNPDRAIASFHGLEIVFEPAASVTHRIEKIFTPETAFSNAKAGTPVPLLGGGPRLGGRLPGAVLLGPGRKERVAALASLPEQHRFAVCEDTAPAVVNADGSLQIPLPGKYHVQQVELAIGDLDVTSLEFNKDGYFGRSGSAQVSVCILKSDGQRIELLKDGNVGMVGWITCGGPLENYVTDSGDSLLISVENDVAMLMAYGISLSDAGLPSSQTRN